MADVPAMLCSLRARMAVAPKVLAFGDSMVEACEWPVVGKDLRWFSWINCGRAGFRTRAYRDWLRANLPSIDWGDPSQIAGSVVHLGTNDYWCPQNDPGYAGLRDDLIEIVGMVRQIGQGRVALCVPLSLEAGFANTADALARVPEITRVRDAIFDTARICGPAVIDIGGQLREANLLAMRGMTQDGVHYSATGSATARDIVGARLAATFI